MKKELGRILIVDDNDDVLDMVDSLLLEEGWSTIPVATGPDAISAIEENKDICIMISDIKMPGIDGIELLKKIRALELEIEVIFMSGYSSLPSAISAVNLGADRYVQKPFTIDHMLATVNQAEQKIRLKRENMLLMNEMEEMNRDLAKLNLVKDEFLSMVSHELRTPLAILKDHVGILSEEIAGPVNDKQSELLGIVDNSIDRLAKIVNNLLDLSKLEAGGLKLHKEKVNVNSIFKIMINEFKNIATSKNIEIVDKSSSGPHDLSADNEKLKQVVYNLIDNAIKYSESGGAIVLEAEIKGDNMVLSVTDNGPGINKEDINKIFMKFEQIKRTNDEGYKGVGLGLAIVKKIVELHSGTIDVKSPVNSSGGGAKFIVTLAID